MKTVSETTWGFKSLSLRSHTIERVNMKGDKSKVVGEYWNKHYSTTTLAPHLNRDISICGLCGNSGVIDTRDSAKDSWGKPVGIRTWCICYNGQALRSSSKGASPE